MVATGNLLDLEEVAKAPLSTVSANTNNVDEMPPRPQVLGSNSVVWVSSSVVRGWFRDLVSFSQVSDQTWSGSGAMTYVGLWEDQTQHSSTQALGGVAEQCPL